MCMMVQRDSVHWNSVRYVGKLMRSVVAALAVALVTTQALASPCFSTQLLGSGFHRRLEIGIAKQCAPRGEMVLRVDVGTSYFVDPFEATDVLRASIRGADLRGVVTTDPHRVDLEAPDFSPLATPHATAVIPLDARSEPVLFELAVHARYTAPAVNSAEMGFADRPFCVVVSTSGQTETVSVCAPQPWPIPRGDIGLLPGLYWATIGAMALGCGAVILALL